MAQITVNIDGKAYRMACEEGQEEHLTELASKFDRYVGHLKGEFGEIGDLRITVMAGILVMDELSEAQRKLSGLESEVSSLKKTRDTALERVDDADARLAKTLIHITDQVERIATKLEKS
ncbi:cell division protein ZapA [Hoeflea sp. TYP-13]|uniref:cell division protein ZapA n=1 Tax=Hoeflea sp. TYP-13 TaxID=3230023 RepID=UPI0034C68C82